MEPHQERRLTTILSADVVGYSRLMAADEAGTHAQLKTHQKELIEPKAAEYDGRIVKLTGDGALMEFSSVVNAVRFAAEVQRTMVERNAAVPEDRQITYRIGINIGDIIVEADDIYGDGVNLATRLQETAEPGGIFVARNVFNQVKGKVDLGFEDLGEQELKNIPTPVQIYRVSFDAGAAGVSTLPKRVGRKPGGWAAAAAVAAIVLGAGVVTTWLRPWAPTEEPASVERMAFPLPDKPSIAVLPFDNLSGDTDQDYFVDALTENIITELSRFSGLFVIARNSVFTYKGKPVKPQQVAEDLGVQYVLEGSMQRSGDRLRITVQLIDALTGNHTWAERYDRDVTDLFVVQDEVTQEIVSKLGGYKGELAEAATKRARRKPSVNLSAYESYLLGIQYKHRFTKEDNAHARDLLNKAIRLDPQFAQAYVGLAWTYYLEHLFGWNDAAAKPLEHAGGAARKALALDNSDAEAHRVMGEILILRREYEQARVEYLKALDLNPNNADILANWGFNMAALGIDAQAGIEVIKKAIRLNPHHPDWYDRVLGNAAYRARNYEAAIAVLNNVKQHVRLSRAVLAASYAQLGQLDAASAQVNETLKLDPDATVERLSKIEVFANPADRDHYREGLHKAGFPE